MLLTPIPFYCMVTSQPIRSVNFVVNIDAPSFAPQEDPVRKPDPEQTAGSGL
jgi:hypothetical protein